MGPFPSGVLRYFPRHWKASVIEFKNPPTPLFSFLLANWIGGRLFWNQKPGNSPWHTNKACQWQNAFNSIILSCNGAQSSSDSSNHVRSLYLLGPLPVFSHLHYVHLSLLWLLSWLCMLWGEAVLYILVSFTLLPDPYSSSGPWGIFAAWHQTTSWDV